MDVVVQFYPWYRLVFPLFWCMVIYDNEHCTKENTSNVVPRIKLNHNMDTLHDNTIQ